MCSVSFDSNLLHTEMLQIRYNDCCCCRREVGVESSADYYNLYCPAESFTLLGSFRLTNRIWRRFAFILECSEDACIVFKIGLVEYYHYRVDYCMELSS